MSVSLLLFLVAIAATIVFFADSAAQWSLRLILDEGMDFSRAKTEVAEKTAAETTPAAHSAKAA